MDHTIDVQGMACEGCESTVKEALESVDGVTAVHVDQETDSANIEGEPNWEEIEMAVAEAGYEVAGELTGEN